ncbi:MAG: glycosyltransferase family 2 protein [Cyanobacteria bacterium J06636_16]
MKFPKISLVTPSFNQARFLEETLSSVFSQNYPNLEYIVMDGGSTDGSVDILKRYENKLTYWVSEPDDGQTDALIRGFAKATGEILGWLCSDDILEPNSLHEVSKFFLENPHANVVYGDSLWIDPEGNLIKSRKEHAFSRAVLLYEHNFIPQPSTFWKSHLYEKTGGLNPDFNVAMDADLWLRFSEVTPIHHVQKCWSRMRIYPEQKTYRLLEQREVEKQILRERYFGQEPDWLVRSKRTLARVDRVFRKSINGCYW